MTMNKTKRLLRLGVFATLLGAGCLGSTPRPAAAHDRPLWLLQFGSPDSDEALGVATGTGGNVYLAGYTTGSLGGPHVGGTFDAWVAKVGPAGKLLWKKQPAIEQDDRAQGVGTDATGNVYIGGTIGFFGGDPWAAKLDSAGKLLWKKILSSPDFIEFVYGVTADAAGNVYLTGDTTGSFAGPFQGGFDDAWVAKLDTSGKLVWKKQIGTSDSEMGSGVATDAAGSVYVAGGTGGTLGGPWVAKFSAAGRLLWRRNFGTPDEGATGVAAGNAGTIYLSGSTFGSPGSLGWVAKITAGTLQWKREFGTATFETTSGVATDSGGNVYVTGDAGPSPDALDAWVAKVGPAGNLLWRRQLEEANAFGVATAAGNVYITGSTSGSLGRPNPNPDLPDAWVAKYSTQR